MTDANNNGKFTAKQVKKGDLIRSADWNDAIKEIERLGNTTSYLDNNVFKGPLTIEEALNVKGNVDIGTKEKKAEVKIEGNLTVSGAISGNIDAENITSGELAVERIPNLSANKITGGTIKGDSTVEGILRANFFKAGEGYSATVETGKWYRIGQTIADKRANAEFTLRDYISSGGHSTLTFRVGISYNDASGMCFTVLNHNKHSNVTFTKVRVLEKSTYDNQYLEVYVNRTGSVDYSIYDNLQNSGWEPVNWTEGSIPDGYSSREFEVDRLFVVGDYEERFSIARGGNLQVNGNLLGAAKGSSNEAFRIAVGATKPDATNWVKYGDNGMYLDIDTSSANFSSTPYYFTSLLGEGNHWEVQGTTSIYNSSNKSFTIYIYQEGITVELAKRKKWHIQWVAIGA